MGPFKHKVDKCHFQNSQIRFAGGRRPGPAQECLRVHVHPAVLQKLDKLVEPLKMTCTTKVKANSVKQEYEKQDELKR